MTVKVKVSLVAVVAVLLSAMPISAHHSFAAEFSMDKPIEMTGTVTKLSWINPHCYVELDVKDASGSVQHWNFEFGAPMALKKAGMRESMLPIGQQVTIDGYAGKDRSNLGWVKRFTFPDGRVIRISRDNPDETAPQ
jgi:hypothetical protein